MLAAVVLNLTLAKKKGNKSLLGVGVFLQNFPKVSFVHRILFNQLKLNPATRVGCVKLMKPDEDTTLGTDHCPYFKPEALKFQMSFTVQCFATRFKEC